MRNRLVAMLAMAGSIHAAAWAADKKPAAGESLDAAAEMLTAVMKGDDRSIPQGLIDKARCVIVVPGVKKSLLAFGAKYGRGFAVCRKRDGSGWSAPSAVRMEGGKVQSGAVETDVVLLAMNDPGMKHILADKFTVSGTAPVRIGRNLVCGGLVTTKTHCASAAAGPVGPVGPDVSEQTEAIKNAEILCWSRSRGQFGGIALEGVTLRPDEEINKELYGGDQTNRELLTGDIKAPAMAGNFERALNRGK